MASMGAFAVDVQQRLRDRLAATRPDVEWRTEYRLGTTPVDIGGRFDTRLALVELEWRRADPANNSAKLFRHAVEEPIGADRIVLFQVFTRYYDLVNGGVSSKRHNAEFVGRTAAAALDGLSYHSLSIDVDPPKRGGERPSGWPDATDAIAGTVVSRL